MTLTVVILTFNEERHISRAIDSICEVAQHVVVVDSGSSDQTVSIAKSLGADVITNNWVNHATQFNWALGQLPDHTEWVLRLDADEITTPELANEIAVFLEQVQEGINGAIVSRRMTFLGRKIRHGGVFPIRILRLFRHGKGRCEDRWMDEHIIVEGATAELKGEIIDDNLNSLSWWTEKHNGYASREVVDILNLEYDFMPVESVADIRSGQHAGMKRWIKENIYSRLPGGFRAFAYFFYRYFLRLGFLDGKEGLAFHFLQGFWYRFLVDAKLFEVRKYMREEKVDAVKAIKKVLSIEV